MIKQADTSSTTVAKARTSGRRSGKRIWLHMKTGSVGELLEQKNARMNSSNDMVKVSSIDDMIPGIAKGKVMRTNVSNGGEPRSIEARSKSGLSPSSRDDRTP